MSAWSRPAPGPSQAVPSPTAPCQPATQAPVGFEQTPVGEGYVESLPSAHRAPLSVFSLFLLRNRVTLWPEHNGSEPPLAVWNPA